MNPQAAFRRRFHSSWIVFLAVSVAFGGCARNRVSAEAALPAFRNFTTDEAAAGRDIHDSIRASFYTYTDPVVTGYVRKIGGRLSGLPESAPQPWQITVLYHDKIYAVSAPGGYIYITTGLVNYLENEAELAGVIAHEMGALQFLDPQLSPKQEFLEKTAQGAAMVGPMFGQIGALAAMGIVLAATAAGPKIVPDDEQLARADALAMQYMLRADYDPQAWINFLQRLVYADNKTIPYFYDYYQSHPITPERVRRLGEAFARLPLANRKLGVGRGEFLEATRGIRDMYASPGN